MIDLDLPISGSLDDPQFSYGKIIWKAIANVITKIVTAPFRALGKLLGLFEALVAAPGQIVVSEATRAAGIPDENQWGASAAFADFDDDGDVDLYITGLGGNVLLQNDGLRFTAAHSSAAMTSRAIW